MQREGKNLIVTILLLMANIAVFAAEERLGSSEDADLMLRMGASYAPYIVEGHEYYRLITHCFLHYGFDHLFNNMVSLLILGYALENVIGSWRFLLIYTLSGIFGGIASVAYNYVYMLPEEMPVSCGASGAIFGLMGALLVFLIMRTEGTQLPRYILYLALCAYSGFLDPSIDNIAHIGGFVTGFLVCLVLYVIQKRARVNGVE